jgi:hypothetical protein
MGSPTRSSRLILDNGKVFTSRFGPGKYHVDRFLAGETVEVEVADDGLLGIFRRGFSSPRMLSVTLRAGNPQPGWPGPDQPVPRRKKSP